MKTILIGLVVIGLFVAFAPSEGPTASVPDTYSDEEVEPTPTHTYPVLTATPGGAISATAEEITSELELAPGGEAPILPPPIAMVPPSQTPLIRTKPCWSAYGQRWVYPSQYRPGVDCSKCVAGNWIVVSCNR